MYIVLNPSERYTNGTVATMSLHITGDKHTNIIELDKEDIQELNRLTAKAIIEEL